MWGVEEDDGIDCGATELSAVNSIAWATCASSSSVGTSAVGPRPGWDDAERSPECGVRYSTTLTHGSCDVDL